MLFACLNPKGTRVKRLSRSHHLPQPSKESFYFLSLGHFLHIVFQCLRFPTSIYHQRNVLAEFQNQSGVCWIEEDLLCSTKTALKDLLQRSILGFQRESNTDLDLLSPSNEKENVSFEMAQILTVKLFRQNTHPSLLLESGLTIRPLMSASIS